jgi:type I restriction enzyme S subunit
MTEWRETTLGEVVELKRGYDLPTANREPGEVPIVSSSGITGHHSIARVHGPGVVTGRYGTLGEVFFIEGDFWPLNTALYVRDFKGNEPRFIAALLQSLQLGRNDGASAVPGINRNQLHRLPVMCPDIDTQRIIATVLKALDNLIENYREQIELLGQLAHAFYQEWVVRFRFPGHENVPLVGSDLGLIPTGWRVRKRIEIAGVP